MDPNREKFQDLADKLGQIKSNVAGRLTDRFYEQHPDWHERYGERGRRLCKEDTGFHLDFIAGAILGQSLTAIEEYARWNVRMFGARNIGPQFIVETFTLLGEVLAEFLGAEEMQIIRPYLTAASDAAAHDREAPALEIQQPGLAIAHKVYLQAILAGHRKAALNVALEAVREKLSIPDIYVDVFQRSLVEVGRLWESNRITVAEEHMATAITQYVIAQIYQAFDPPGATRGRMVIAGVQGEYHQVGAVMVADVMESDGWDVRYLGTNMPHEGILKAIEEHKADAVGISTTILANIPQAIRLVESVRQRFPAQPPRIILGGSAFRNSPELVDKLKVYGYAPDLRAARKLMGTL